MNFINAKVECLDVNIESQSDALDCAANRQQRAIHSPEVFLRLLSTVDACCCTLMANKVKVYWFYDYFAVRTPLIIIKSLDHRTGAWQLQE